MRLSSLLPGVAYIHLNSAVRAHDGGVSWANLVTAYPPTVNADRVWSTGHAGQNVTVAVLDSGITPDADLIQPTSRILAEVNFADGLNGTSDPGGHGTHVAGAIAGNGYKSGGQYIGVAPGANLVDVRVLDSHGNGRASSVILGIQLALDHRTQYNIRACGGHRQLRERTALRAPRRTPRGRGPTRVDRVDTSGERVGQATVRLRILRAPTRLRRRGRSAPACRLMLRE